MFNLPILKYDIFVPSLHMYIFFNIQWKSNFNKCVMFEIINYQKKKKKNFNKFEYVMC